MWYYFANVDISLEITNINLFAFNKTLQVLKNADQKLQMADDCAV